MPERKNKPAEKTRRLEARITPKTAQQIADLAEHWGGVRALSLANTVEEAVDRAWKAEFVGRKKSVKNLE